MKADATDLPPPARALIAPGAGDAVTALYQAHALGLIRLAVVMLGDLAAAEDAVQEAFCGLYRRWPSLSDHGKALSYVRSSVINSCRSVLRRRRRQAGLDPSAANPPGESAEALALIGEEHRQVLTAIRSLPARQREALVLRFYLDLDEEEIAAASTVSPDSVPPLELPAGRPRAARWRRPWQRPGWLVPVAAAAAVVLIAVTAVTVRQVTRTPAPAPGTMPGSVTLGPMPPGPSVASYVSAGTIPPYFVAVSFTGQAATSPAVAVVHDTVSGRALATIRSPIRGGTIRAVSAAAGDRTFLLDEQPWVKYPSIISAVPKYPGPHTFYLLRLNSDGRVSSLTRLRVTVPATQTLRAFALSPDARSLALVVQAKKHSQGRTTLEVVTLSTGAARVWVAASGFLRSGAGDPLGLSWTADGRQLAFEWQVNNVGEYPPVEVRLLNLTSPGSDLLAGSRRVITTTRQFTPSGSSFQVSDGGNEPVLTPDGSAVVTNAAYFRVENKESGQATNGRFGFAEYSTRTGKLVRILGTWKVRPAGYWFTQTLWSSPSGRVLIVVVPDGRIGVVNGNEFTPLTMPPVPSIVMDVSLGAGAGAW